MKIFIDTDVFVDVLRGYQPAEEWLTSTLAGNDVFLSVITEAELLAGDDCNIPEKAEATMHMLSAFSKLPVSSQVAQKAGEIKRNYRLELPDALIAASAMLMESVLFTKNLKDFARIKELKVKRPY